MGDFGVLDSGLSLTDLGLSGWGTMGFWGADGLGEGEGARFKFRAQVKCSRVV